MALHEQSVGATDEWYTPAYVFEALGCEFDLDVASPGAGETPWIPARRWLWHDSLNQDWRGFIWMNPPFGKRNGIIPWMSKFIEHRNGIALTPDRTSAPWWQECACQVEAILFVSPKIKFVGADGILGRSPAQGTSLMAIGEKGCEALQRAKYRGLGVTVRLS